MKTCTCCEKSKPLSEFYFDTATDVYQAKCRPCQSKFNTLARQYRKRGEKLSSKEFKEQKLYLKPTPNTRPRKYKKRIKVLQ